MTVNLTKLFEAYGNATRAKMEAIIALKAALPADREDGYKIMLPVAAKKFGVPLITSTSKRNAGALVLDASAEHFSAAKLMLWRLMNDVYGSAKAKTPAVSNKQEPYKAPHGIKGRMNALLKDFTKEQIMTYLKNLK